MTSPRRPVAALLLVLGLLFAVPGVAAADDAIGGEDNAAVAVNTEDGASVFRLAFSVRMVANDVVDETNSAYALASCTDCQTVALAFQVVLVWNDPNVAVPENLAVAYNDQCVECLTYASATQIVLGFDGPVRLTDEGRRRIQEWLEALQGLEDRVGELSPSQLDAEVAAAKAELIDILSTELVAVKPEEATPTSAPAEGADATTTTTTTTAGDTSSSTTTTEAPTTTTTTTAPATSSTTAETTTSTSTTTTSSSSSTTTTTTTAPTSSTTTTP